MTGNEILILGLGISIILNIIFIIAFFDESQLKNFWRRLYETSINSNYKKLYDFKEANYIKRHKITEK